MNQSPDKTLQRNVDTTSSSMDMVSLNNLVVSMRGLTKMCYAKVLNKLNHRMKQYRKKSGSEEQKQANARKADRLEKEVEYLKATKIDRLSKCALANTTTLHKISDKMPASERAAIRLSSEKRLQQRVLSWRSEHSDWQALAAFLLYKNTGRRMKKKTTLGETKGVALEFSAGESSDQLRGIPEQTRLKSDESVEVSMPKACIKTGTTKVPLGSDGASDSDDSCGEGESHGENSAEDDSGSDVVSDSGDSPSKIIAPENTVPIRDCDIPPKSRLAKNSEIQSVKTKQSSIKQKEKDLQCIKPDQPKGKGEMVVQRFCLKELDEHTEDLPLPEKPEGLDRDLESDRARILFSASSELGEGEKAVKNKSGGKKDSFFSTGDSDDEGSSSEASDDEMNESLDSDEEPGATSLESTFVGSLAGTGKDNNLLKRKRTGEQENVPRKKSYSTHTKPLNPAESKPKREFSSRNSYGAACSSKPQPSKCGKSGQIKRQEGNTVSELQQTKKSTNLHPSWEASRRKKQEQTSIQAFEGTRITFDD